MDNLAACRSKVPFLRHYDAGQIEVLQVAVAKEVTRKPKLKKLPAPEGRGTMEYIVLAQIGASKFVVHPGPVAAKTKARRSQYPTAAITIVDGSRGKADGAPSKRRRTAKATQEDQAEPASTPIVLPDDLAEINTGAHRGLRDVAIRVAEWFGGSEHIDRTARITSEDVLSPSHMTWQDEPCLIRLPDRGRLHGCTRHVLG